MPNFTVRIVLDGAEDGAYNRLHDEMEDAGFDRTVRAANGKAFHLPPGEYSYTGWGGATDVRDCVWPIIRSMWPGNAGVLVTTSQHCAWYGFDEADE
ncbi:MAG: hypothetical protein V4773_04020 [Verrucomicrobiota bacterium]